MNKKLNEAIIEFVGETVSSISPYKIEEIKRLISEASSADNSFLLPELTEYLSQGDIVENVEYPVINEQTKEVIIHGSSAIVLSNSCNILHKDRVLLAPIIENVSRKKPKEINSTYETMCIDETPLKNRIILFDGVFTVPTSYLFDRIKNHKSSRTCSLSIFGINLLYLKLSVFLMRPESRDITEERQDIETSTKSQLDNGSN